MYCLVGRLATEQKVISRNHIVLLSGQCGSLQCSRPLAITTFRYHYEQLPQPLGSLIRCMLFSSRARERITAVYYKVVPFLGAVQGIRGALWDVVLSGNNSLAKINNTLLPKPSEIRITRGRLYVRRIS